METIDRPEAERFIKALTGSVDTVMDWRRLPDKKSNKALSAENKRGTLAECWTWLKESNEAGHGIFALINETDGRGVYAGHVKKLRAAFIDDDTDTIDAADLHACQLTPSIIVQSNNGIHAYWLLAEGEDLSDFKPLQKALAKRFTTDHRIADLPRVMRIPGFLHQKNPREPFLVYVIEENAGKRFTVREIVDAFAIEVAPPTPARVPSADSLPPSAGFEGPAPAADAAANPQALNDFFAAAVTAAAAASGPATPSNRTKLFQQISDVKVATAPLKIRMDKFRKYLKKMGPAVQGDGGDSRTFQACRVSRDFDLPIEDAMTVLMEWNETCSPPWAEEDLFEKLSRAGNSAESPPGSKCRAPTEEKVRPGAALPPSAVEESTALVTYAPPGQTETTDGGKGSAPTTGEEHPLAGFPGFEGAKGEVLPINALSMLSGTKAARTFLWLQTETAVLLRAKDEPKDKGPAGLIRYNLRTDEVVIVGKDGARVSLSLDEAWARFDRNIGDLPGAQVTKKGGGTATVEIAKTTFFDQMTSLAKANAFDPVDEYLNALPEHDGVDRIPELLACLKMKAPNALHEAMLRKTLIGAVARVKHPGAKVDTMTILHDDKGGKFKSTFFRKLFGDEVFSDDKIDVENKDTWMMVNRFWGIEWSEMHALAAARSREGTKAFLSRQTDTYRAPYARSLETHPRRSIFVGTTNNRTQLENDGGLRRFWFLPDVGDSGPIDVEKVEEIRDQLWAQALAEYRAGTVDGRPAAHLWWFDEEQDALHAAAQEEHVHDEIGMEQLAGFVVKLEEVTTDQILGETGPILFKGSGYQARAGQIKIARMLRELGWERHRAMAKGARLWRWKRTDAARAREVDKGLFAAGSAPPARKDN